MQGTKNGFASKRRQQQSALPKNHILQTLCRIAVAAAGQQQATFAGNSALALGQAEESHAGGMRGILSEFPAHMSSRET